MEGPAMSLTKEHLQVTSPSLCVLIEPDIFTQELAANGIAWLAKITTTGEHKK
jgi:hypothetical protein